MTVQLLSASHHSHALSQIGLLAGASDVASRLTRMSGARGAMVLATCNRFELYLDAEGPDAITAAIRGVAEAIDRPTDTVAQLLSVSPDAVGHLCRVAAGLDSAVVGDREIRGQVRRAVERARRERTMSASLEAMSKAALETAREVALGTSLSSAGRSAVSVALDLAADHGIEWATARAVIAGTGSYAGAVLAQLRNRSCTHISAHSASGRADEFAARHAIQAIPAGGMADALADADIVITCRGMGTHSVTADMMAPIMSARAGHPLVVLDMALHRDVEDAVGRLPGIRLITLSDVGAHVPAAATDQVHMAEEIVARHTAEFANNQAARALDPEVVELRRRVAEITDAEIARLPTGTMTTDQAARALHRLANTLLHTPTQAAHDAGRRGDAALFREALARVLGVEAK